MSEDSRIIDINEEPFDDDRPVEVPEIKIESPDNRDSDKSGRHNQDSGVSESRSRRSSLSERVIRLCSLLFPILVIVGLLLLYLKDNDSVDKVPLSREDGDNIAMLRIPYAPDAVGTELTSDTILDVAMDFYSLDGLRASLEMEMPDTTDTSLVLFMRSSDYQHDGSTIGTTIIDGVPMMSREHDPRLAYIAVSKTGRPVLGVSQTDKIEKYVSKSGESMFRQYMLLSDGYMPQNFYLHGKVERAAIGRTYDGNMYYIVTKNKESMYDFADALREYGFVDAIYITGGKAYTFYRDKNQHAHIPSETAEKIEKYREEPLKAPLLVFRNK